MGTGDTRQDDAPAGGVGTITPPAGQSATGPAARPGERRDRRPGRPGPAGPRTPASQSGAPLSGLRSEERSDERRGKTADSGAAEASGTSRARRGKAPGQSARRRAGQQSEWGKHNSHRVPFFFLLCGLLGGALVSALVISTTLAEGSFEITRLQQSNNALAKQRQMLQEQVAAAQSAQTIEERALKLGMRPAGELRFLDLKTGKVRTDAGGGAAAIDVPGYTP
jgi:hypothetical protein